MSTVTPITLLTIEDDDIVRQSIAAYLGDSGFSVLEARDGVEGLEIFAHQTLDIVLTDLRLPGQNGLTIVSTIRETNPDIPIVIVSGTGRLEDAIEAIRLGAWDYVTKPIVDMADLELTVNRALERARLIRENRKHQKHLEELVRERTAELLAAYDATLEGWSLALELRDQETQGHSHRVTEMTVNLARAVGVSEADLVHLKRGAVLHDIGKMSVPDQILLKPASLTEAEWRIMRLHPVLGYEMLSKINFLKPALDIPYCHHEKWDGTGYPRGLQGEAIPLAARIFAVVDVWDALCHDRPYRQAWSEQSALEYIRAQAGKHFDPAITQVFLTLLS